MLSTQGDQPRLGTRGLAKRSGISTAASGSRPQSQDRPIRLRIDTIVLNVDREGVCGFSGRLANETQITFSRIGDSELHWQHNGSQRAARRAVEAAMRPKQLRYRVYTRIGGGGWRFSYRGTN